MALTVAEKVYLNVGSSNLMSAKITGDGTVATYDTGYTHIDTAWTVNINETTPALITSWSGGTLTFGAAPESTKSLRVFVIGS